MCISETYEYGISVIMLAYSEEENLKKVLPNVNKELAMLKIPYEVIVVDTAKPTDNSETVCRENSARYINQKYPKFGGAFRTGIEEAKKSMILTLDSDGAHPTTAIRNLIEMFNTQKYDVVIGSRYAKGGGTNDPFINVLMSKMLNTTYSIVFHIKAKDMSTNFRVYNTVDIKDIPLESENYDVLQELLIKLKKKKGTISIGEYPIVLQKRISGESKRDLWAFIKSYVKTLVRLLKL